MKQAWAFLLSGFVASCAGHKLIVESNPADAEVYSASTPSAKDRKLIGHTPLEIPYDEAFSSRDGYLIVSKPNFERQNVYIDRGSFLSRKQYWKFELVPGSERSSTTSKLLAKVREAQSFVHSLKFDKAHEKIDEALHEDPTFVFGLSFKSGIYYLQGKLKEAEAGYDQVLEMDPGNTDALRMLRQIKAKKDKAQ